MSEVRAECPPSHTPPVLLSIHETQNAAWDDMDKRMWQDHDLPGNGALCPEGKTVGDTLMFAEIVSASESR